MGRKICFCVFIDITRYIFISKKYRYQAIKQRNNQNWKTRLPHEIKIHKWQDNMNLYANQRWNQVLRKDKHFLLRMRHPSWCHLCCIKEF